MAPVLPETEEDELAAFRVHMTGFGPFTNYPINPSWIAVEPLTSMSLLAPPSPLFKHGVPSIVKSGEVDALHAPERLEKKRRIEITTEMVAVTYENVQEVLPKIHSDLLEEDDDAERPLPPDLVVHVGVGGNGNVKIEQVGRRWGYEKLDFAGKLATLEEDVSSGKRRRGFAGDFDEVVGCLEGGEEGVRTIVQGDKVLEWLTAAGVKCVKVSEDAGLYLCEFINFGSIAFSRRKAVRANEKEVPVQFVHVPPIGSPYTAEELTLILKHIVWAIVNEGGLLQ